MIRRRAASLALCLVVAGCAGGGGPGAGGSAAPPEPPRIAVFPEAGASAVGLALTVHGSAWETAATAGLTLLTARTLLEQARPALDALGARADVECGRALFTLRLLAPSTEWHTAADVLLDVIARSDPGEPALARARLALRRTLTLDAANPSWQARLAARQALYGPAEPWGAPPCGVPETLDLFDLADIRDTGRRMAAGPITAALVGELDPADATTRLRGLLSRLGSRPGGAGAAGEGAYPAPPTVSAAADSVWYAERNTITAWSSVAFPFDAGVDPEAVHLLGATLVDAVSPGPSRPAVFDASYEVDRHGGGGALIVHFVSTPEAASAIGDTIEGRAARIAREGLHPAVYARVLRRHLGLRLLALAEPESRAAVAARRLALGDAALDWPEPESTGPSGVTAAAVALGRPVRAVVGPRTARPRGSGRGPA